MERRHRPIGVFDSGIGGLSVVAELVRLLPSEEVVYLADTAHFPYGQSPPERIRAFAGAAAELLLARGAKMVVIACNTASSVALRHLRQRFPVPFVGMVPAVKPASLQTKSGKVGILATNATVQGQVLGELVQQFAANLEVHSRACPGLVELVERGGLDSPETRELLLRHVDDLCQTGVDVLVLGCSHFALLRPLIERLVGPGVAVVDTALPVARQAARVAEAEGLVREGGVGAVTVYTTGDVAKLRTTLERIGWLASLRGPYPA